ncbi:MAG: nickel-responsive transcriptional regulator NikR [Luteolibacter sp.]|uniref:nickel-responsive transcriptional regulator NikR n=1 Tax=Luteolibacter sp. TaxID=1962973 RepID=UPI00326384D8
MEDARTKSEPTAHRVTISIPDALHRQFEELMTERGFVNRSQAIAEVLTQHIADYYSLKGNTLMAGTITLFYDHKRPGIKQQISDIQHEHIREVISSLHVLLQNTCTMEVILVQGPSKRLRQIANRLLAVKGVMAGRLNLTRTLLPQIQTEAEDEKAAS